MVVSWSAMSRLESGLMQAVEAAVLSGVADRLAAGSPPSALAGGSGAKSLTCAGGGRTMAADRGRSSACQGPQAANSLPIGVIGKNFISPIRHPKDMAT